MDYTQWAKETFKNDIFATEVTGIEIKRAEKNYAMCTLNILPKHLNAANSVMGGVIFTLADFTFAVAANVQNPVTISLSSNINYLNTTKGTALIAQAKCIKEGKKTCVFNVEITDNLNIEIAVVTITGYRKSSK